MAKLHDAAWHPKTAQDAGFATAMKTHSNIYVAAARSDEKSVSVLPRYTASVLGERRTELAEQLRARLLAAGYRWPSWLDSRPGRVQVLIGDCADDPPLGQTSQALLLRHGTLLLDGLAALGLITGTSRLVLCARREQPDLQAALQTLVDAHNIEGLLIPAAFPSFPELEIPEARDSGWVIPATELARVGAIVRQEVAPRLCTVAGAVLRPQVVSLADVEVHTPEALVAHCGGLAAGSTGWVALAGGALAGQLWDADEPIPAHTSLLLILPVAHPLVQRTRRTAAFQLRAQNACQSCDLCTRLCPEAGRHTALTPHLLMRELARDAVGTAQLSGLESCTGCGVCSAMCPAELLPGRLLMQLKAQTNGGSTAPPEQQPAPPLPLPDGLPRLPLRLLETRLGLTDFAAPPVTSAA